MKKQLGLWLSSALVLSMWAGVAGLDAASAATSPKSVTTCLNNTTGAVRLLLKGLCSTTEKKIAWSRSTKVKVSGAMAICTNIKSGQSRILSKGICIKKTELKSVWVKVVVKSTSTMPTTLACATGGACTVGSVGPGGGLVIYVSEVVQAWGARIEIAPVSWHGTVEDPQMAWCDVLNADLPTKPEVGTGATNTALIVSKCSSGAAVATQAYRGGGKSDWFLPSREELRLMYLYAKATKKGGFAADYWSSSQDGASYAFLQNLGNGGEWLSLKRENRYVRPIRVF